MNKLHSFAFCALVTPVLTFGAGSVLAQQTTGSAIDRDQQTHQSDRAAGSSMDRGTQGDHSSTQKGTHGEQTSERARQLGADKASDRSDYQAGAKKQNRGHIGSVPAMGMRSSDLMDAKVSTARDNDVGPVEDLVIDQNGQVVAIIVGVGGFLGMGEKDVAIGWDNVTKTGTGDDLVLRVDVTREDLQSAPEFEDKDD